MTEYLIPEENLDRLANKLEILNRKAVKTGSPLITHSVGEKVIKYIAENGNVLPENRKEEAYRTTTSYRVEVSGVAPKFEGWSFVGTLDYTEHGNVFRCMPSREIPESFRNVKPVCDHCKKQRSRKDTFVLAHDNGHYIQVGRQCLRDFLGHSSPERIATLCQFLLDLRGMETSEGGRGDNWRYPSVEYVVAQTVAIVKAFGWVSRHYDDPEQTTTPTTARVWTHLSFSADDWRRIEKTPVPICEQDKIDALAICEWVMSQGNTDNSFVKNLWIVFQEKTVSRKNVGLVAAAFKAYEKATAAPKVYEVGPESNYVGEVGKREVFQLTVTGVTLIERKEVYGYGSPFTTLFRFKDEEGNRFIWFASDDRTELFEKDQTYAIKATVKKHDEYKGKKQTVISRAALAK